MTANFKPKLKAEGLIFYKKHLTKVFFCVSNNR